MPYYSYNNSRKYNRVNYNHVNYNRDIPSPPEFIQRRDVVTYNHLPRHPIDNHDNGTATDRIGWVILHKDLIGHVETRIRHIPHALESIQAYRALARAVQAYATIKTYMEAAGAPKSEKELANRTAKTAYYGSIEAAENVIATLATPTILRALKDLLPLSGHMD